MDGFRTSHEVNKIAQLSSDDIRAMIDDQLVRAHRLRAMDPDRPVLRGSAQNPDVFFQAREAANPYYDAVPEIVPDVPPEPVRWKTMGPFAPIAAGPCRCAIVWAPIKFW